MKPSLLAVSVLSCLYSGAIFADYDHALYGDFRYSANSIQDEAAGVDDTESLDDNASRIGLKGWIGTDEFKAIYNFQFAVNIDNFNGANNDKQAFDNRFAFAGFKSKTWGSIIYGRTSTPYKMAGLNLDPFYDTSANGAATNATSFAGAHYGLSELNNGFTDNSITYTSPELMGLTANASIFVDDSDNNEHDYNLGLEWNKDAFKIGTQYVQHNTRTGSNTGIAQADGIFGNDDGEAIKLYSEYKADNFKLGFTYERLEPDNSAVDNIDYLYLTGSYNLTKDLTASLSYGAVNAGLHEGDAVTAGLFYQILEKTQVYGLVSDFETGTNTDDDRLVFSLGVSHQFSLGVSSGGYK